MMLNWHDSPHGLVAYSGGNEYHIIVKPKRAYLIRVGINGPDRIGTYQGDRAVLEAQLEAAKWENEDEAMR